MWVSAITPFITTWCLQQRDKIFTLPITQYASLSGSPMAYTPSLNKCATAQTTSCTVSLKRVCPSIVVIWEEESQLDATQCFIELVTCSTCFGHVYAHHQELTTILLVWHVACNSWLLVVGRSGAGQQAMRLG